MTNQEANAVLREMIRLVKSDAVITYRGRKRYEELVEQWTDHIEAQKPRTEPTGKLVTAGAWWDSMTYYERKMVVEQWPGFDDFDRDTLDTIAVMDWLEIDNVDIEDEIMKCRRNAYLFGVGTY